MTTTEDSSASLGPRYAPKDPTLPDPWQGLIDGGTGVIYYWNPETNITQYEKPPPSAPPLQSASNGTMNQNPGQPMLQPAQQMFQQPAQQMQHQQIQPMPYQQAHQYPQAPQIPQISYPPYMQGPMYQYQQQQPRPQLSFQQVQNYAHQQGQPIKDPQLVHSQGQQQHDPNRQPQYPRGQQSEQNGFPSREDLGNQEMKRTGFSSPLAPQSGQVSHSQAGQDTSYRREMAQMGNGVVTTQTIIPPPMGLKIGFDPSSRTEVAKMLPQQPKIAPLPIPRDQQAMRVDGNNQEFVAPGHSVGLNMVPGNTLLNMHNQAAIQNATPLRPSPKMFDSSDYSQISAAEAYCKHHEVTVMGDNVPAPFMTFEATGFPPELLREIHLAGFSSPTPIQAQTWPLVLQSRDIVAIAKTGSGKTLGYLIPAFIHLRQCRNNPQSGPTVLVLAPTRELATQIQEEAIKFGRSSRISCTCLYGGAPKGPQLKEIERGTDIVVATPGRLNDILEMERINLRQISLLVLDEADRMLDMGFEPQIRKIVNQIPSHRQTIMFTATWPNEVKKIAGDLLVNPVQVNIGRIDQLVANKSITQYVEMVSPMNKQRRLEQIIRTQERGSKIIIFCSTKRLCDQLARGIGRVFGASAIHGDKSQVERDNVLNQFRSGKTPVLVATDVAARGLDIKDIRVVVNYDFPTGIEDYVHRIGRTGRAGATGISYTFFSDQDWKHAPDLVKVLEGANQQVPPEIREMAARGGSSFSRGRGGMMSRTDSDRGGGMMSRTDSGRGGGMMSRMDSGRGGGMSRADSGRGGGRWDSGGGRGNEYGARNDSYGGRGGRGRGFAGPSGPVGRGRHDRGPQDRYNHLDGRGRFYDGDRRPNRGYNRDYERSRSRSRSRSWSRSRSRSRSWSRSRSRSRSYERPGRPSGRNFSSQKPEGRDRASGFDVPPVSGRIPGFDVRPKPDNMPTGEENVLAPRAEVDAQPAGPEPGAAQE